ncbi:hypothetical protein ABPG75_004909 [Micractinium tetrahymenae]
MRSSRRRVVESYDEGDSDCSSGQDEWRPTAAAAAAGRASRHSSRDGGGEQTCSEAAAAGAAAGSSGQHHAPAGSEDWEEEQLLAMLSPESQKRERRRIANRDCARRIRQRKTELLADLTASVEQLQADNTRLLATLTEVTRSWRDTSLQNCELRAQIALLQAGGSGGSRSSGGCSSGGTGGGSGLLSPVGLAAQLGSPGWPSPMAL